jgi:antitoxin PrlF
MPSASVTSKGQVTIPQAIRERLKLKTGDRLDFVVEGPNVVLRAATPDVRALKGLLHRPGRKPGRAFGPPSLPREPNKP